MVSDATTTKTPKPLQDVAVVHKWWPSWKTPNGPKFKWNILSCWHPTTSLAYCNSTFCAFLIVTTKEPKQKVTIQRVWTGVEPATTRTQDLLGWANKPKANEIQTRIIPLDHFDRPSTQPKQTKQTNKPTREQGNRRKERERKAKPPPHRQPKMGIEPTTSRSQRKFKVLLSKQQTRSQPNRETKPTQPNTTKKHRHTNTTKTPTKTKLFFCCFFFVAFFFVAFFALLCVFCLFQLFEQNDSKWWFKTNIKTLYRIVNRFTPFESNIF